MNARGRSEHERCSRARGCSSTGMRESTVGAAGARGWMHALRVALRERREARATAAREALFDCERSVRERYFAAASDAADLERRQRAWDRDAPHGW